MSANDVEYYNSMRVIAMGREGTIIKCPPDQSVFDVQFADNGEIAYNVRRELIRPFENFPVAKQIGGPPTTVQMSPAYFPSNTALQYPQVQMGSFPQQQSQQQPQPQYQYPVSQPPQTQTLSGQQYYVGGAITGIPVYSVASQSTPITVTSSPTYLTQPLTQPTHNQASFLPGFPHSPPLGTPFRELFDCNSPFAMACWCPCILAGQVAERIHYLGYYCIVTAYVALCIILFIVSALMSNYVFWLILWVLWSLVVMAIRMRVRRMFQIPGDACDDCSISFCCTCCSLTQIAQYVFGYRPGDSCKCGPDGKPDWQSQQYVENVVSGPSLHGTVPYNNNNPYQQQQQQQGPIYGQVQVSYA